MKLNSALEQSRTSGPQAFSLIEVIVAMAIMGLMIVGVVVGFTQTERQSEWSTYSLAAQAMAMQRLEQARAAKWDPQGYPPVDLLTNSATSFTQRVDILDIPISGTNIAYATNKITITTISANPPLKLIRVDCTWPFLNRGTFTNTVFTYRAPDQ